MKVFQVTQYNHLSDIKTILRTKNRAIQNKSKKYLLVTYKGAISKSQGFQATLNET